MTLPIPLATFDQHIVALGKTRSGKSSKMRVMIETALDRKIPVAIIDPKGDWWGLKSSAGGKRPGYPVVIFGGAHADVPINAQSGKAVAELVAIGNRPSIIDLKGWTVADRTRFFIAFAEAFFAKTKGRRILAIDEAHNFAPQVSGRVDPQVGLMLHWANRLASEGAGLGITLISASQRPQKLHKDYLSSHETLIACRVIHKRDRQAYDDWIEACGDKTGDEVLATVANMKRDESWVWSPEIGFGPKRITWPMFKTYDSFKPQAAKSRRLKGWASVDLDEVRDNFAVEIEQEKANDPKALRGDIAKLKTEKALLEKQLAAKPAGKVDPDAIKKAEQRGFEQAKKKFGPAVSKAYNKAIVLFLQLVGDRFAECNADIKATLKEARATIPAIDAELAFEASPALILPKSGSPSGPGPGPARAAAVPQPKRMPSPAASGDGTYNRPQVRVLQSLAMWRALGHDTPSRPMVAAVAGYTPSSGGFNNLIGSLGPTVLGAISIPQPGRLRLEADGIDVIGREDGRDMLLNSLNHPQKKIIGALIDAGTRSRAEVGENSGYTPSSGGFNNLLGSLSTLGIIVKPQPGHVALSDWAQELFSGYAMRIAA